ncbi:MAG TPA: hypothetical protein VNT99_04355, partial [Methylomirabilota bacterium]|nr:hypothetical protein [Methylomirabilota bacterium]
DVFSVGLFRLLHSNNPLGHDPARGEKKLQWIKWSRRIGLLQKIHPSVIINEFRVDRHVLP